MPSASTAVKFHDAFAAALVAEGCDTVFGLMGDGNLPLYAALGATPGIAIHAAHHEAGAVGMADGYHRASGRLVAATVTWGPGLTQCATQLTVAARNRTPLLLITGLPAQPNRDRHQALDARRIADLAGVPLLQVTGAAAAAEQVAAAVHTAWQRRTPVILEIPIELQSATLDSWRYLPSARAVPAPLAPDPAAVERLADALAAAERPVLIAGRGAVESGARSAIEALAERCGALLATTMLAKDHFIGHPWDAGIAGGFASAAGEAVLPQADLVIGFGALLDHFTLQGGALFPAARFARVDLHALPDEPLPRPGPYVQGDARLVAEALLRHLEACGIRKTGLRSAAVRASLDAPPAPREVPADGIDPAALMHALAAAMPDNARVSCGVGHYWGTVLMHLALPREARFETILQFGSIGQAFTSAIGAALAGSGRPQIVIEGDGSFLMQLAEVGTAARSGADLVVLLVNDAGYGAEVHKLKARGFDAGLAALVSWRSPDFVALAQGFGGDGATITQAGELGAALARGLARGGLFVIDARVSPTTLSDSYLKQHLDLPNRAPRLVPVVRP